MNRDVKVIEIFNGEKLIATVDGIGQIGYILRDVVVIAPQPEVSSDGKSTGRVSFTFVPWPIFKDVSTKTFELNSDFVLVMYVPNQQILDHYQRSLVQQSGLVLPPSIKPVNSSVLLQE